MNTITNKKIVGALALSFSLPILANAATVIWDGGGADTNWTTAANWDGDVTPSSGDTVNISNGDNVIIPNSTLAGSLNINVTGNSTLTRDGGAVRLNNASVYVEAGSTLAGTGFWDLGNADFTFDDGAIVTVNNWELKGTNEFTFNLGASGFTTLTPNTFRNDGNNAATPTTLISDDTFTVDMANYTGGTGIITLMDFTTDAEGMDNATFQNATLNVTNAGSYVASLQWNDTEESIELNITTVPEPSSAALLGLGSLALLLRRRK